ncbi:MAG: flippase-like domain-containing protein [Candidatus Lokiarchaeota archaeon]|nr:flippase-like domain-containing protein [Candidatus Lokiarchaeota archaeon]
MDKRLFVKHAIRLIGVAWFIYIMIQIDLQSVFFFALSIDPIFTVILIALMIPILFLKGARWQVISRGLNLRLSTVEAVDALCLAQMTNLIVPGSLGDFVRVPYLTSRGNPTDQSILSLFIDATISVIVPYTVAVLAIIEIFNIPLEWDTIIIPAIWILGGYVVFKIIRSTIWPWFLEARIQKLNTGISGELLFTLRDNLKKIGKKRLAVSLLLSLGSWLFYTLQWFVLAYAMNLEITWFHLAISFSVVLMLTAIPITILGLGIREGVLIFMFGLVGIDTVRIISFSLILLSISFVPSAIGFISWAKDPIFEFDSISEQDKLTEDCTVEIKE